jgi:hypothetical protein
MDPDEGTQIKNKLQDICVRSPMTLQTGHPPPVLAREDTLPVPAQVSHIFCARRVFPRSPIPSNTSLPE